MSLLWPEDQSEKRGQRWKPNPKPRLPNSNWAPCKDFPSLAGAKAIAVDVEAYDPELEDHGPGWGRGSGHILGISLATPDGFNKYFPIRHREGFNHNASQTLRYVADQLSRPNQPKVGHNALYDVGWLEHEGVAVKGQIYCTMTAEKLIQHSAEASLEATASRYLGEGKESTELYDWAWSYWGRGTATGREKRKLAMKMLRDIPAELVGPYAESDTRLPLEILPLQFSRMDELGLMDVYQLECDLIPILVQIRLAGVSVNIQAAEETRDFILNAAEELQKEADQLAGRPVNTGSPKEVAVVFDRYNLRYPRTEKTGAPSFKGEFLKTVDHRFAQIVVELEELKKYNSTFIENAILGSQVNGKIHCQFNPLRAVTGRMSSSDPNLQQVPSRNELAKMVRKIFVPDDGHDHWRKYDYSSIESRILAHDARGQGAKALRQEYCNNPKTDYHDFTIRMIQETVGILLDRKPAKTINFGILYGMMVDALARRLGIPKKDAERLFNTYHDGLPYVNATMSHFTQLASTEGEIRTVLGRRTLFDRWEPKGRRRRDEEVFALPFDQAVREYGPNIERAFTYKALNYRIQGSAADLMKMAIVKCHKAGIFDSIGFPRLIVHDELDWSVMPDWDEDAFTEMKNIMETAIPFRVPIRVEGEWGPNWSELYALE